MYGCGLHVKEALRTDKEDFRQDGRVLRARESFYYKEMTRDIPVPPWLWAIVRPLGPGPLMPSPPPYSHARYDLFLQAFNAARDEIGLSGYFTPSVVRLMYGRNLLAEGIDTDEVSHRMGHKNSDVTRHVYANVLPPPDAISKGPLPSLEETVIASLKEITNALHHIERLLALTIRTKEEENGPEKRAPEVAPKPPPVVRRSNSGRSNQLLTTAEAADYLGVTVNWMRSNWRVYGIRAHRIGRHLRYRVRDLEGWLLDHAETEPRARGRR